MHFFSQLLKDNGHEVALFDTTFYEFDDEIKNSDTDSSKVKRLTARPILEKDDDALHFEHNTTDPALDLRKKF